MHKLATLTSRLPIASLLILIPALSSCSRPTLVNNNGVSIFGLIYYILAGITILNILKQPTWSFLKKVIWTAIVLVPFGLILYYLISGRDKNV